VRFHVCAVDGVLEEVELLHWTTLEQPLVADRFQPVPAGEGRAARFPKSMPAVGWKRVYSNSNFLPDTRHWQQRTDRLK